MANTTRPDIAFTAGILSRFCSIRGKSHWMAEKRVLRYLKATIGYRITYRRDQENLRGFTDSDWAGDVDDRKSCSGNLLLLSGGPIGWKSKQQSSVALSTMKAKYAALSEISREIVYIKRLFSYIGFEKYVKSPVKVYCDNQSAIELSKNAVFHKRSKHIDIAFHFTRELVEKNEISISYLRSDFMPADVLTKPLTTYKHNQCVKLMGMSLM